MSLHHLLSEDEVQQDDWALVDLSQIALATVMATYEEGDKLTEPMIRHLVLSTLKYNVLNFRKQGYNKICIAVDSARTGYWRRQEAWYYKDNRAKSRAESDWDWDSYFAALAKVISEFRTYMPYHLIEVEHAEADDIIGVLSEYLTGKGSRIKIISSDGDFTQLQKFKGVSQWSPMMKKAVVSKHGDPTLDLFYKIVKGDKKDNIAPITVRDDFHSTKIEGERCPPIKTKWLLDLYDDWSTDPESIKEKLTSEQYERFLMNEKLNDLTKVRSDIAEEILDQFINYKPAKGRVYSYFVKSGLTKLLPEVGSF